MSTNPPQQPAAISPLAVATAFIKQYYLILSTNNSFIHKFYKADSRISFSPNSNTPAISQPFSSLENVEEKFAWAANSRVDFANGSIDAQESVGGGIIVVVTGEMFLDGKTEKKLFVQTFFLKDDGKRAPRRNYFVFNDVFRFLDGDENVQAETPTAQNEIAKVTDETVKETEEKITEENDTENISEKVETLEFNGSNGKSEAVAEPEPDVVSESEPVAFESETTKETEKENIQTEDVELAPEPETEAKSADEMDENPAPKIESTKESDSQEAVNTSEKVATNNKQKPKPPGSWASLVAGSSSKTPSTPAEAPPTPPVPKPSLKTEKESSNGTAATSSERSKRPPRPQELESESSAPAATASRASGYGSKGSSSLYIKNVGEGITESNLRDLFSEYPFKIVNVSFYPSRGYAFVDFADANAVNSIMKENRQTFHINGRAIEVEKKTSDRRRSGGNSSGAGSGSRGGSSNGGSGNRRTSPKGQRQRSHSGRRLNGGSDGDKKGRKGRSGGGDKKRDSGTGNAGSNSGN